MLICNSTNESIVATNIAGLNSYSITAKDTGSVIIKIATIDGTKFSNCYVKVIPSNIPSPWVFNDIRETKGGATFENNIFTIEGGGSDIWNSSDQFAYLNLDTNYNTSISAKMISQQNTDSWAKAGLMFREKSTPNSSFIMLAMTPGNGLHLQWRPTTSGNCSDLSYGSLSLPAYLKLLRHDNTFISYKSVDGVNWDSLGFIKIATGFGKKYKVGMGVLSHNNQSVCVVKFDNVEVNFDSYFTPVSISEIKTNKVSLTVSPNPINHNLLTLKLENFDVNEKLEISILDMSGRMVVQKSLVANNVISIDLTNYKIAKGIYILQVSNAKKTLRSEFIVD